MKAHLNKKTSEFEVIVDADKNIWKDTLKKTEQNLIAHLAIKGFRKGKVPPQIAKKHIAQAEIFQKSIEAIIKDLSKEAAKKVKKDMMVLDAPGYRIEKISNAELAIKFSYPIYPEFTIGDYKKIDVKYLTEKIDSKTVNEEINRIADSQTMLVSKKGTIEKGDVVILDYEGFVDKKAFEGGKAEKHQLEIGSNQFIPGFEEQMIGLKAGTKKELNVVFPKDYQKKDLQGKKAVFKIKIHEVKFKELPKIDDDFAKSVGVPQVKDMKGLKAYIKNIFTEQAHQRSRATFQRQAFDKIIEKSKDLVVPNSLIIKDMETLKKQMEAQLQKQKIKFEDYMKMVGLDKVKMDSHFRQQSELRLKDSLIFAEIAKIEKISVKEDEYDKQYKKLAKIYNQSEENIKNMITKEQIQIPITNDKVIDKLIAYNSKK